MTDTINTMTDIPSDDIQTNRGWFQTWRVDLCHGFPGESGIVVDTEFVTKKWERVEDVMIRFHAKAQTLPQHERGEWYITVAEMANVARGSFTMDFIGKAIEA